MFWADCRIFGIVVSKLGLQADTLEEFLRMIDRLRLIRQRQAMQVFLTWA